MSHHILLVDDEPDVIEYLQTLLEDNGYSVRTANDGFEAMARVKEERPDLILLDLQMPEETGTGFYRKLNRKTELQTIPVIIVSGLAGRHVAVSKSVPVIDKPFDENHVLNEVKKALKGN